MDNEFLLIIDVQKGFINDWTRHIPERVSALQQNYQHVAASRFVNPPGSMHRRLIGFEAFTPGSDEAELAFEPRPGADVFDKTTYSCLTPGFRDRLTSEGVSRLHLCGIATDNCVLKTAVDLFETGIEPIVLAGACASHGGPDCHEAGLMLMKRMIGSVQVRPD